MLPVDAQIMAFEPDSTAFVTAIVIPLSLKLPVGFKPSYFKYIFAFKPIARAKLSAFIKGVLPSHNEITGVFSSTGKYFLYFSINPKYLITLPLFYLLL